MPADLAAPLCAGLELLLSGEVEAGLAVLHSHILETGGFSAMGRAIRMNPRSLARMFRPGGNPLLHNLAVVIAYVQRQAGIELHITTTPRKRAQ